MPSFSDRSLTNLEACHEDLQTLFKIVVFDYDCSVICGHRDQEAQEKAYSDGFSKVTFPNSRHNTYPSMAVDVVPYPVDWHDTNRFYHFGGYVTAVARQLLAEGVISHEIRWGGDWDRDTDLGDQTFMDYPHFELVDG